jgi:diguanylate cyclase (GGDEF)-like protein
MRESVKKRLLKNLLVEVSKRYETLLEQNRLIYEKTAYKAVHDNLTGLYNRAYLMEKLESLLHSEAAEQSALMFIDLDDFKLVNDTAGHYAGDAVLKQIAGELFEMLPPNASLIRFGGDEFVLLLEHLDADAKTRRQTLERLARKVLERIAQGRRVEGHYYFFSASIGIVTMDAGVSSAEEALRFADSAMYEAKKSGKGKICFFDPGIDEKLQRKIQLANALRVAVENGEMVPYFQPQVDPAGRTIGAEMLLRWHHPEFGSVAPGEFIPIAEEQGLIVDITHWLLEWAVELLSKWRSHKRFEHLRLSINCSALDFMSEGFDTFVTDLLARWEVEPARLVLEITETVLMQNHTHLIDLFQSIHDHGVGLAIDDFGTGYSSLAYLKTFPFDELKIDRSFIEKIPEEESDLTLIKVMMSVAEGFGMRVVTEGVENREQIEVLRSLGYDFLVQGYFTGKPMSLEKFENHIDNMTIAAI